ncbi:unnamed protein product, partial [marine sediment metagenome]
NHPKDEHKPEDDVNAVRINIIVQAIKENKRAIIENRELTRDILKSLGIDSEERLRELME